MTLTNPINPRRPDGRRVALIFGAAEHHCGLQVCSGCGLWIGLARELAEGAIARTVCPACVADSLPAVVGSTKNKDTDAPAPTNRRHSQLEVLV